MSKRFPKMGWVILVAMLCLSLSILPACGEGEGEGEAIPLLNPGDFVQESIGDMDSLDPHWAYDTSSGEQIQYIYEPLIWYDEDTVDAFVGRAAVNWTFVNATQVKFYIRKGVQFHSGNTLTPADVEYSFERALVMDRAGGPTWMFNVPFLGVGRTRYSNGTIRPSVTPELIDYAVEVDGDYVVFNQLGGTAYGPVPFLQVFSNTWASILDRDWCIANGEWPQSWNNWTLYNNPAKQDSYLYEHESGTGKWKLGTWAKTSQITLNRNEDYWAGNATVPFNNVITKWVQEWSSRKLSLLAGDADHIYVPRQYMNEIIGVADLTKYSDLPDLAIECLFFNFNISSGSPYIGTGSLGGGIPVDFFEDLDVRKAMNYVFDWDTFISDLYMGEAAQRGSPIVDGVAGYNPAASKYSHCMTLARYHFENSATYGNLTTQGFKFTVVYNTGNTIRQGACEILAESLLEISENFQVSVQPMMWSTFLDTIMNEPNSELAMFCVGWVCDYPDADNFASPFMHTFGDYSYFQHYGNSTIDALIETARYSTNVTERTNIYYQLQDIYYNHPAGVILAQAKGRRFFTKYIHGFYFNPTIPGNAGPLWDMSKY